MWLLSEYYQNNVYFIWWKCAIIKYQVYDIDPFCFKFLNFVRWFTDPHYFFDIVLFQFLLEEQCLLYRIMVYWYLCVSKSEKLTWIKVWMVWSLGRSVIRNFMFLYSISAGSGLISFTLMLLISFLDNKWCKTPTSFMLLSFMFLIILYDTVSLYFCDVPHYMKQQRLNLTT